VEIFHLQGEYISLANAIKVLGLVESGGRAKERVREGEVSVNGAVETRPGRKLVKGDRFGVGEQEWVVDQ
jgi:ribosome-associated protein